MPISYCRTPRLREALVAGFYIKPYAHIRLLNGQTKESATGDTLERSYYCFTYLKKDNKNDNGTFICGRYAGEHFCQLINVPYLKMFNPLQEEPNGGNGNGDRKKNTPRNNTMKQLYNAINIVIVCWNNISPESPLIRIKEKIEDDCYNEPSLSQIKAINTIISRDYRSRTVQGMLTELRENNEIRELEFNLLNEILERNEIESYFG